VIVRQHLVPFIIFFFFQLSSPVHSAVLGSYDHIRNLPGHLTLNTSSPYYKGIHPSETKGVTKDGIDRRTPSRIIKEDYLHADGTINKNSLYSLIKKIELLEQSHFQLFCHKKKDSPTDQFCLQKIEDFEQDKSTEAQQILKSWNSEEQIVSLDYAKQQIQKALHLSSDLPLIVDDQVFNNPAVTNWVEALWNALEIIEASKQENEFFGKKLKQVSSVLNLVKDIKIKGIYEATNLISSEQIIGLRDPIDSGLWRKPKTNISEFDITNYNHHFTTEENDLLEPDHILYLTYLNPKGGGTTPKFNVKYKKDTLKLKFKVEQPGPIQAGNAIKAFEYFRKIEDEVQSEFVANQLAAAVGFTVDPTFYKKNVRLLLKDKYNPDINKSEDIKRKYEKDFLSAYKDFIGDLEKYGVNPTSKLTRWNYRSALDNIQTITEGEQKGRHYILIDSVSLEFRSDEETQIDVGAYPSERLGKIHRREYRGLALFRAWLNDVDTKEDNSELKLVANRNSDHSFNLVFSPSDMGATLGDFMGKNFPNLFPADLIKNPEENHLVFNTSSLFKNNIWDVITKSDIQWMASRIGQVTRTQLEKLFQHVDYPPYVANVFIEKLLRRRDQLLVASNLIGKTLTTDGGNNFTPQIESRMTDPKTFTVPGYEDCFQHGELRPVPNKCDAKWTKSITTYSEGSPQSELRDVLIYAGIPWLAQNYTRKLQAFNMPFGVHFEGSELSLNSFIPARYIIENPLKTSDKPYWIIDLVRIGVNLKKATEIFSDLESVGFSISEVNMSPNITKTWELMRIRAVKDPKEFSKSLVKAFIPGKNLIGAIQNIKKEMVESLDLEDILISSSYLSFGNNFKIDYKIDGLGFLNNDFRIGIASTLNHRLTLFKDKKTHILGHWQDITSKGLASEVVAKFLYLKLISFKNKWKKLKTTNRLYEFDLNNPEDKDKLYQHLSREIPNESSLKMNALRSEELSKNKKVSQISALGIAGLLHFSQTEALQVRDPQGEGIEQEFLSAKKGYLHKGGILLSNTPIKNEESTESITNNKGQIFVRHTVNYSRYWAKRQHFKELVQRYQVMLPRALAELPLESVNYYLGTLSLQAKITISPQGIEQIFQQELTKTELCTVFTSYFRATFSEMGNICQLVFDNISLIQWAQSHSSNPLRQSQLRAIWLATHSFVNNFIRAQDRYTHRPKTISSSTHRKFYRHLLKDIISLFETQPLSNYVTVVLLNFANSNNYYRTSEIKSSAEGFPIQEDKVSIHKLDRGTHSLSKEEQSLSLSGIVDDQISAILQVVQPFFYDYFYKEGIYRSSLGEMPSTEESVP